VDGSHELASTMCNDAFDCGYWLAGDPQCNNSCIYPVPGCIDNGQIYPNEGYSNNQFGAGSVMPGQAASNYYVCSHDVGLYLPGYNGPGYLAASDVLV